MKMGTLFCIAAAIFLHHFYYVEDLFHESLDNFSFLIHIFRFVVLVLGLINK